ncbi:class I SAM-dependent methyltransferase [bacterium]|nr:class I SAM-dependent methyltransferase [bacterium]
MTVSDIGPLINQALTNRSELREKLHTEETDAYRLFHGVNEGRPGLTIDRYGSQVLVQTFHQPFDPDELPLISEHLANGLDFEPLMVFNDRSPASQKQGKPSDTNDSGEMEDSKQICRELGVRYVVKGIQKGKDPLLFLDLRVARRFVLANSSGLSVLNLFAYTCGVGICASIGGANEVLNVDFATSSLETGKLNAELNQLSEDTIRFIQSDYFPVIRQFAGLPVSGRGRKRPYLKLEPRQFDLVFLDPPRWAKSHFGTVDLIRDYQGVFKPALLTVHPGGRLICTNHVPKVNVSDWLEILRRCAQKAGRPVRGIEVIEPEADFPSPDGMHPLKIAVVEV